jgi:hypothetical protein
VRCHQPARAWSANNDIESQARTTSDLKRRSTNQGVQPLNSSHDLSHLHG